MSLAVTPLPNISFSVGIKLFSVSLFHIHLPLSFIVVSVGIVHLANTHFITAFKVSFVPFTIRVDVDAVAMIVVLEPLAKVD